MCFFVSSSMQEFIENIIKLLYSSILDDCMLDIKSLINLHASKEITMQFITLEVVWRKF